MLASSLKVVVLVLFSVTTTFATWQIPDTLVYEGKQYSIFGDLLTPYFKKYPDRNPKDEDYMCSANWKGYHAVFEIREGLLTLKDISKNACSSQGTSELSKVVPDGEPLKIDWYTGVFVTLDGENPGDSYGLDFLYSFENYSLFEFEKGRFSAAKHFDNKGFHNFKKEQFEKYMKTEEYREEVKNRVSQRRETLKGIEESIEFWLLFSLKRFL